MLKLEKIIETVLYCHHLQTSITFYNTVLKLKPMVQDERFSAFNINGQSVFLLFQSGASLKPIELSGGMIPAHDGHGPTHMAFAISTKDLSDWEKHLNDQEIEITSRVVWPLGGTSLYFNDPDNHLIELATPGVWEIY